MIGWEFERHVRGQGLFTDDLQVDGALWGHVLRSPHSHAKLQAVHCEAARATPGVVAVFTEPDLEQAGIGSIPCLWPFEQMASQRKRALARGCVRHVGEAIAFIVAESRDAAVEGGERLEVDYDVLPSVTDAKDALATTAPQLWEEAAGNVCYRREFGDAAATDAAFARAFTIVKRRLRFPRVVPNTIEPRAALAVPEAAWTTLTTQTQGAQFHRGLLAEVFGCSQDELQVVTPDVGGSFGMKAFLYPEQILVTHAARELGRPVRWTAERSGDAFLSDNHARDVQYDIALALDSSHRILALRIHVIGNMGAYHSSFAHFNAAGVDRIPGPYHVPTAYGVVTAAYTNTVPTDSYRGAVRAEAVFPMEQIVEAAARELSLDPAELRRSNLARTTAAMRTNCFGYTSEYRDCVPSLDEVLVRFGWQQRASRRAQARACGKIYGAGLACYLASTMGDGEKVRLAADVQGMFTLWVGTQSSGQGHETAFTGVVAQALSIPPESVRIVQGDTRAFEGALMTAGSRSIAAATPACDAAAKALIERGKSVAARLWQVDVGQISYREGTFVNAQAGTELCFKDLVAAAVDSGLADSTPHSCLGAEGRNDGETVTYPSGAHVCDLEVDPQTGEVQLLRYVCVDDVGRVLTPDLAAGQIGGGVVQGYGQAMLEACHYDPNSGQLLNGSWLDYAMPRAADVPKIESHFLEDPSAPPRGIGEMGTIASTPAFLNAVMDALGQIGATEIEVPATPERIWRACRIIPKGDNNDPSPGDFADGEP